MESTNSGSIQSSSTGDNEEYDAVVDSPAPSSFFNLPPPPPLPATTPPASSSIFDSFSPYFAPFPFPAPPPEQAATWASPPTPPPPLFSASAPSSTRGRPTPPPVQVQPAAAPRGPKKRTRASRRAPTTVINTETSNFRAMVQQFTGFPTPPFAASPFPARPRLDLFGASAAGVVPPFLLRPSAHKVIPSPSSSSSSSSSSSASLFDHAIASIARSHLATTIGATPDPSNSIPPKYHDHDKFNLSLFDNNMQRPGEATFSPPPFLQPPQPQMAPPPPQPPAAFPSYSAAMNPRWDVEDQESEQRQNAERARSKFHFRNFHNNQN